MSTNYTRNANKWAEIFRVGNTYQNSQEMCEEVSKKYLAIGHKFSCQTDVTIESKDIIKGAKGIASPEGDWSYPE